MTELQEALVYLSESLAIVSMARINDLIELLNTLLLSSIDNIVMVDKSTLTHIQNHVQESQDTIEFLQLESQFQHDELQQKYQHSELVIV